MEKKEKEERNLRDWNEAFFFLSGGDLPENQPKTKPGLIKTTQSTPIDESSWNQLWNWQTRLQPQFNEMVQHKGKRRRIRRIRRRWWRRGGRGGGKEGGRGGGFTWRRWRWPQVAATMAFSHLQRHFKSEKEENGGGKILGATCTGKKPNNNQSDHLKRLEIPIFFVKNGSEYSNFRWFSVGFWVAFRLNRSFG